MPLADQIKTPLHELVKKYKLPVNELKNEGYDGRVEWRRDENILPLLHRFRLAVFRKDIKTVQDVIESLQAEATEGQSEHLASLLCNRKSAEPTKEAFMTAICIGSRPLVEFILPLFLEFPGEEKNGCRNSSAFQSHITPLMLACICNNFAITECLLLRNHEIPLPHRLDCICDECMKIASDHKNALITADIYRAICSPPFLWLATTDPLLAAIQISKDLEICARSEEEFKIVYEQLIRSINIFAETIIQQCWSFEEVDTLLSRKEGAYLADCQLSFPRIRLALDSHLSKFVSNLNVQCAIEQQWMGDWADYEKNNFRDAGRFLRLTLLYPFLAFIHSFSAGTLIECFKYPFARYITKMTSYIVFLSVLLMLRLFGRSGEHSANRAIYKNPIEFGLECYVWSYVFGMSIMHYMDFANKGLDNYYELWWRWFDLIMLWLYSGAFFSWIMSFATVYGDELPKLHRKHWIYYDFSLLYDIYFGAACIMAFWRIFYFIQLKRQIGSTVISIWRCVMDVLIFLAVMSVVMLCFSIGLTVLYQPYNDNTAIDEGNFIRMKNTFSSVIMSWRNLYWSFYGYLGPWDYMLVVGNAGPQQKTTFHLFTIVAGELLVGFFHIVTVVTILNLMISILVRKMDEVIRNEDVEWKFFRCHIFLEYADWHCAVPPPFNLIFIITHGIYRLLTIDLIIIFPDILIPSATLEYCESQEIEEEQKFQKLLRILFERYRCSEEHHYKTLLKVGSEKIEEGSQMPKPILLFLNGSNS